MSPLRRKRESVCGFFDVVRICLILSLVLLNTGFLPVPGTQTESHAILGVCAPGVACPATCAAPVAGLICTVTGPPGAKIAGGTCGGWCGGCFDAPKCGGAYGLVPCWCSFGC